MRIVFDASSLISAALKSGSIPEHALLQALSPQNRFLLSPTVFDEYRDVLFRPKFDRFVALGRLQRVLDIVVVAAEMVEPAVAVRECRDPKDDKYLSLAAAGRADVIVSSDIRHLLSMHPWRGIAILSSADFLALP